MNDQVALSSFKNGLNQQRRATVLTARPKSLNDAIQFASEVIPQQNSIMHKKPFNNREKHNNASTYNNNRSSKPDYGYYNNYRSTYNFQRILFFLFIQN